MEPRKIDKAEWTEFCDRVSLALAGKTAEIEIASPEIGDQLVQPEGRWLPFQGITYDHKDDLIEIAMTGVDHMVRHPQELYADLEGADLVCLTVIDGDGTKQFVRLRDPLMLPPH
jgi:hypothetical protein